MGTYSNSIKKAEKAFKKRMRIEKEESINRMNEEIRRKERMFFLLLDEEKRNTERMKRERKKEIERIQGLLNKYGSKLNYREWLTLRDYLIKDYVQIESDLNRNKIDCSILDKVKEIIANEGLKD